MKPETLQVLTKTRELLADAAHWTKGAYARNGSLFAVSSSNKKAVCWCLQGAINKVVHSMTEGRVDEEIALIGSIDEEIEEFFPMKSIMHWNDDIDRTHEEVVAKLDEILGSAK